MRAKRMLGASTNHHIAAAKMMQETSDMNHQNASHNGVCPVRI